MKVLELMERLGLWPFDGEEHAVERPQEPVNDDMFFTQRAIRVPAEMQHAVHAARWPAEYSRRILH